MFFLALMEATSFLSVGWSGRSQQIKRYSVQQDYAP